LHENWVYFPTQMKLGANSMTNEYIKAPATSLSPSEKNRINNTVQSWRAEVGPTAAKTPLLCLTSICRNSTLSVLPSHQITGSFLPSSSQTQERVVVTYIVIIVRFGTVNRSVTNSSIYYRGKTYCITWNNEKNKYLPHQAIIIIQLSYSIPPVQSSPIVLLIVKVEICPRKFWRREVRAFITECNLFRASCCERDT